MYETWVTVVGNVASDVKFGVSANGHPLAHFRLASTVRRYEAQKEAWTDAFTSFYTVWTWRTLATNVASSVKRGQPLMVRGQLRIKEAQKEGQRFLNADLIASAVGHDLSRGTASFVRGGATREMLDALGTGSASNGGAAEGVAGAVTTVASGASAGASDRTADPWSVPPVSSDQRPP